MEELVWCAHGHRVEPDRLTDTTDEQGDEVCDICITHYDECEHCDTMLHFATSTQIDGAVVCPDCEVEHYAYCHGCADAHKQDDMRRERGDWYCESCHEDLFTSCDDCGDRIDRDEAHRPTTAASIATRAGRKTTREEAATCTTRPTTTTRTCITAS